MYIKMIMINICYDCYWQILDVFNPLAKQAHKLSIMLKRWTLIDVINLKILSFSECFLYVMHLFSFSASPPISHLTIGLIKSNGQWVLPSTGQGATFLNFRSTEPNGDGDCVCTEGPYQWNDIPCRDPHPFLCEYELA